MNSASKAFCLYDWANSAFATTILAVVFQTYFVAIVPDEGAALFGYRIAGDALWTFSYGLSVALVVLVMPIVGAAADATGRKKAGLTALCALGSVASAAMFFVAPGRHWLGVVLLILANIGFAGGNVLYNAFLPIAAPKGGMDLLSAKAYAFGYLGGGLLLAVHLGLVLGHESLGLSQQMATRVACGSVGLWWIAFGLVAIRRLPAEERRSQRATAAAREAARRIRSTMGMLLREGRDRLRLLTAILLYQNGIQTVIVIAAIVGQELLHMSRGELIGAVLLIQLLGVPGSWAMGRAANRFGAKRVILVSLVLWTMLTTYAAVGMSRSVEFWGLAVAVGLVLGGSQALSRSLFASVVPEGRSAEYFGFYAMSDKLSAVAGPLTYAVARQLTGSVSAAALSLAVFFIAGFVLLLSTKAQAPHATHRRGWPAGAEHQPGDRAKDHTHADSEKEPW